MESLLFIISYDQSSITMSVVAAGGRPSRPLLLSSRLEGKLLQNGPLSLTQTLPALNLYNCGKIFQ